MEPLVKNNLRHWAMDLAINHTLSDLQHCSIPIDLVCGDQSNPVANAICNHLAKHTPNNRQHRIKDASHFLVTSHTDACLRIIESDLSERG
jgi:pimeloyl-ACP methyl ester carboxylesterase